MNNNKHCIAKSIVRVFYVALIYFASKSSISVSQLILLSSACILFAPILDLIIDKISDDI